MNIANYVTMLGMLMITDISTPIHSTLCIYSTSSNLTVCYNLGATAGVLYALQVFSGISIAMSYCSSDTHAFIVLDMLCISMLCYLVCYNT